MVTIDDFAKLEFKVGAIIAAEEIEGSDKLLNLQVDFGPKTVEETASEDIRIASSPSTNAQGPRNDVLESATLEEPETSDPTPASSSVIPASSSVIPAKAGIHHNNSSMEVGQTEQSTDIRQILSGIKQWYKPEDLVGKQFVFITNLAPRKMMGLESQGMIMAAEGEDRPIPLIPSEKVPNGAKIR